MNLSIEKHRLGVQIQTIADCRGFEMSAQPVPLMWPYSVTMTMTWWWFRLPVAFLYWWLSLLRFIIVQVEGSWWLLAPRAFNGLEAFLSNPLQDLGSHMEMFCLLHSDLLKGSPGPDFRHPWQSFYAIGSTWRPNLSQDLNCPISNPWLLTLPCGKPCLLFVFFSFLQMFDGRTIAF